jgi:hypothetical protein
MWKASEWISMAVKVYCSVQDVLDLITGMLNGWVPHSFFTTPFQVKSVVMLPVDAKNPRR